MMTIGPNNAGVNVCAPMDALLITGALIMVWASEVKSIGPRQVKQW